MIKINVIRLLLWVLALLFIILVFSLRPFGVPPADVYYAIQFLLMAILCIVLSIDPLKPRNPARPYLAQPPVLLLLLIGFVALVSLVVGS